MAATSKAELLAVTAEEFNKLEKLVRGIEEQVALEKDEGDTSIKDIVAHRAHWIDLFLGWLDPATGPQRSTSERDSSATGPAAHSRQ